MSIRKYRIIEKIAVDSSYGKDFLYGVDPTGRGTFESSMKNKKYHTRHKTIGAAGGFLGGAIIIPSVISGIVKGIPAAIRAKGGIKGKALALGREAILPYKSLWQGYKSIGKLKGMKAGKLLEEKDLDRMSDAISTVPARELRDIVSKGKHAPISPGQGVMLGSALKNKDVKTVNKYLLGNPEATNLLHKSLSKGTTTAAAGIGISGGVNALSAVSQYNSGQKAQRALREK